MRSAFKRGVKLLSEPESDHAQSQGQTVESPLKSAPEHLEGLGGVPINAHWLEPIINELMRTVIMIATCPVSANVM
jgi:hypothetical protein